MALIERDPAALELWDKAIKKASKNHAMLEESDEAVWQELERREDEMHQHIPTPARTIAAPAASSFAGSSAEGNTARAVYSAKFYNDVACIHREIDEEDAGIVKPSRRDRLVASRTRAYDRGDIKVVQGADKLIEKRQVKRRPARARKKKRKVELRDYVSQLERNRIADPPSDNDGF